MCYNFDKDLLRQYMMGAANPGNQPKNQKGFEAVDLHLYDVNLKDGKINDKYAIEFQLEGAEKAIDDALLAGKTELRLIHGIGKGKLKDALHKMLKKHPHVASFDDSYHHKYGNGSTLVYFF